MGKVLFFDIDGTLVDFRGRMPESTRDALLRAKGQGHRIVICSGRAKAQMYPWLLELGFDGVIGGTGAYVECDGRVIYEHFIPQEYLAEVIAVLEESGAAFSVQTKRGMAANRKGYEGLEKKFRSLGVGKKANEQLLRVFELDEEIEKREDVQKFVYQDSGWSVEEIASRLKAHFDITPSSFEKEVYDSGEVTLHGIDKAFGMKKYIDALGICREDTFAFGDGPNDFDMLEFAGTGIAMGNARPALKEIADFVTTDISEDGIANGMRQFGLI